MAHCFCFIDKVTGKSPSLQSVDDDIRRHFNAPADAENYFHAWYSILGFAFASGHSIQDVLAKGSLDDVNVDEDGIEWSYHRIALYLDSRFTVDSWRE